MTSGAVSSAQHLSVSGADAPFSGPTAEKRDKRARSKKLYKKKSIGTLKVLMCVTDCKYDVVREAARGRGWELVDEDPDSGAAGRKCHVYWVDVPSIVERMQQLQPWQRINHFPGMSNVARKGRLAQNLNRLRRSFPQEFNFYPRTWVLPAEWGSFKAEFDASGKSTRTFIVKPDSGCQGKGIFLTQDLDRVDSMESQVAQIYVRKPLLIEGFKFDLRVYVLVTSVIPLHVYVFKDGLARFCTEEYLRPSSENLGERCMHLTNYAVNKRSDNFVENDAADRDDRGSKRSLRWLLGWIAAQHGEERADMLWKKTCSACVKTLVSILPTLSREYLQMFGPDKKAVHISNDGGQGRPTREKAGGRAKVYSDPDMVSRCDLTGPTGIRPPHIESTIRGPGDNSSSSTCDVASERVFDSNREGLEGEDEEQTNRPPASKGKASSKAGEGNIPGMSTLCKDRDADGSASDSGVPNHKVGGTKECMVEGSRCVEILGFDFMIDAVLKPWLIEVNHLPSFATDSPLDLSIKSQVVETALAVLRAKADDRTSYEETSKRDAKNRLYNADSLAAAAGSLPRGQERKETEAMVAKIRKKVEAIYVRFAPHKVERVGGLLSRYAGNEEKLLRLVRRKYMHPAAPGCAVMGASGSDQAFYGDKANVEPTAPSHGSDPVGAERLRRSPPSSSLDPEVHVRNRDVGGGSGGGGEEKEGERRAGLQEEIPLEKAPVGRIDAAKNGFSPRWGGWLEASVQTGNRKSTHKRGDTREDPATVVTPSSSALPPLWAIEDDPESLSREACILPGWERLHPPAKLQNRPRQPQAQCKNGDPIRVGEPSTTRAESRTTEESKDPFPEREGRADGDGGGDAGVGGLGKIEMAHGDSTGGKSSVLRKKIRSAISVESMIRRAFQDDLKMTMRLKCPLQQNRGGAMDPQNRAASAILGPEQRAKAQRLMEGYSSGRRRSTSAPSVGDVEVKSQLPASLRLAVVRAKEWRRRRDEDSARRVSRSIAVKVQTFSFDGSPGGGQA